MAFNLDQLIDNNLIQIIKDYLNVNSLENYDIKIDELLPQSKNRYFNVGFVLTHKLTLLKNYILAISATSQTYNNQKFSLSNQNHIKKLYNSHSIDLLTINSFKQTNSESESKIYSLTINNNKEEDKKLNFLFQLQKVTTYISTTPFAEKYLIEYKLNKNIELLSNELKKNLINSYKEKKLTVSRENSIYKTIESFKPYELTYKIFYEMAIRNENAKKILHALNYLYDISAIQKNEINIDELDCMVTSDERMYTVTGAVNINNITNYKIFVGLNNCKFKCVESIDRNQFHIEITVDKEADSLDLFVTLESEKYQDDKAYLGLPVAHSTLMIRSITTGVLENNKKTNISVKIDNIKYSVNPDKDKSWLLDISSTQEALTKESFLKKYHNYLKPEEHQIYFSTGSFLITELIQELETQLIEEYLIYPEGYDVNHPEQKEISIQGASKNALDIQKLQNDSTYKHKNQYSSKQDEYDGFSIHQGILKGSDRRHNLSTIKQDTIKQVVDYNISNFQINLNLPKKELISYLTKLKENYDNDNSILMSPMELLGEGIGIDREDIKKMDSIEWADTFYIYDYFKNDMDGNMIDKEGSTKIDLTFYHDSPDETNNEELEVKNANRLGKIKAKYSKKKKSSNKEFYLEKDTIRNRYDLMEKLIDKEKYKLLI